MSVIDEIHQVSPMAGIRMIEAELIKRNLKASQYEVRMALIDEDPIAAQLRWNLPVHRVRYQVKGNLKLKLVGTICMKCLHILVVWRDLHNVEERCLIIFLFSSKAFWEWNVSLSTLALWWSSVINTWFLFYCSRRPCCERFLRGQDFFSILNLKFCCHAVWWKGDKFLCKSTLSIQWY